jgi:hypothetical protein
VDEERNGRRGGHEEKDRREKAHGRRCLAANARRSPTPKGASVVTIS